MHRVGVRGDRPQVFCPQPAQDGAPLIGALVIEVDHERGPHAAHLAPLEDQPLVRHPRGVAGVDPDVPDALRKRPGVAFWRVRAHSTRLEHAIEYLRRIDLRRAVRESLVPSSFKQDQHSSLTSRGRLSDSSWG